LSSSAIAPNCKDTFPESWEDFGRILDNYIHSNITTLDQKSYDVILGFSRGGTILANAFACLLKDNGSKIYSDPLKASVRPIPRGLTLKAKDSCFIMNQAATYQEVSDIIENLERDLVDYKENIIRGINKGVPINVLIMDDNLTGATRVSFLEDILEDMKSRGIVANHDTLAYVRHRNFLESEIPTIRAFPKDPKIEMFSMPWHKPSHEKKDLHFQDENIDLIKFKFKIDTNKTLDEFKKSIASIKHFRIRREKFLVNGSSEFLLEYDPRGVIGLNFLTNKYYPPKRCLESGKLQMADVDADPLYLPICSFYRGKLTIGCCLMCSVLNCNEELFRESIESANSEAIFIELIFGHINDELQDAIKAWMLKRFPDIMVNL